MKRLLPILILLLSATIQATTRYVVSPTATGPYTGAWATHWTTIAQVNSGTTGGDTVVFASGIWRGTTLNTQHGTNAARTCYIDSGFYASILLHHDVNHFPTRRVAWIYGSDSVNVAWTNTGWTHSKQYLWRCNYTPQGWPWPSNLWQGDRVLRAQHDTASETIYSDGSDPSAFHSGVDVAGTWWYNGSGIVYAWLFDNANPNSQQMEFANRECVNMGRNYPNGGGQDCVSIIGLGFKYGDVRVISNSNDAEPAGWDTLLISHVYMSLAAGWGGVNPSCFYNDRAGIQVGFEYDPLGSGNWDGYDRNRIVACSIGTCWSWTGLSGTNPRLPQVEDVSHGNGITFYGYRYGRVDSNTFFGHVSESSLYFKCPNDASDGAAAYDTVAYNRFEGDGALPYAIRVYGSTHDIWFWGNIIRNASAAFQIGYYQLGFPRTGYNYIWNNTFYNCGNAIAQYDIEARGTAYAQTHNQFKWNVVYNTSGREVLNLDTRSYWADINFNLYYAAGGTNSWDGAIWTSWIGSSGFDLNSIRDTNPNFNNASASDFSRPLASNEMFQVRGTDTFTVYGAIQGPVPLDTFISISGDQCNEGGDLAFVVSLSVSLANDLTFHAETVDNSATAGVDYTAIPDSVYTILAGQVSKVVVVHTTARPTDYTNHTMSVHISNPNHGTVVINSADGVIVNTDVQPTGACCLPNYTCATGYTASTCTAAGGTYQGDGTSTCSGCSAPTNSGPSAKVRK